MINNTAKHWMAPLCLMLMIGTGIFGGGSVQAHKGATGIVKERMDLFKRNQELLKAMRPLIAVGDMTTIISHAEEIALFADKMPDYFPVGSDDKPSEALPQIWQAFDDFRAAAMANANAARQISATARQGDKDALKTAIIATGASCKSCHRQFRQ